MIYLASPYTVGGADEAKMQERYEAAVVATAKLVKQGHNIFSPIVHSHPLTRCGVEGLGHDFAYWSKIDYDYLDKADQFWVLTLDGWRISTGIRAETDYWNNLLDIGVKRTEAIVKYVDPSQI